MELALVCWPGPSLTQPWGIRTQAGGGGQGAWHSQPPKGCLAESSCLPQPQREHRCKEVFYFVCFVIVCIFIMSKMAFTNLKKGFFHGISFGS